MRDIPCNLGGYTLMVTEPPEMKMQKDEHGNVSAVVDRVTKAALFVVGMLAKQPATVDFKPKGEEIRVTVETDPGELGFGTFVELINVRVSPFSFKNDSGQTVAGISFRAAGVKPKD